MVTYCNLGFLVQKIFWVYHYSVNKFLLYTVYAVTQKVHKIQIHFKLKAFLCRESEYS
jgi:hypothetical protein